MGEYYKLQRQRIYKWIFGAVGLLIGFYLSLWYFSETTDPIIQVKAVDSVKLYQFMLNSDTGLCKHVLNDYGRNYYKYNDKKVRSKK